ncbi:flagellar basal-body MS-ring/collar protein FliF [Litorisediminicola beolgyonensis]|uniref:Flagellar M-ring protein n=1 Tax=Litorisediminicola beolgyonensis TaxID=1173614 RepID=A0ABW3ZFZ8_9RHOB
MLKLKENLGALGRGRVALLGATGLGMVLVLFLGLGAVFSPAFRPLYGNLDPASAGRIVSALEQAGYQVRLDQGGTTVSVPEPDVARARMVLAERGLPADGVPGWELFDEQSGLGMNTFLQKVNRMRALEGELTRSIRTLEGIEGARVHLVLPEREAFSRTRPDATASVIVRARPGYGVSRNQALAIRALVSSAVPDLRASDVTILSSTGETILGGEGDAPGEVSVTSRQSAIEDRLAQSVTEILAARVGADNVRVETAVTLTSARQVIRQESFDPDQQVIRSTETRAQNREDADTASGSVSVVGDIPPELADGAGQGPTSTNRSSTNDEIVNYEIGTTLSETVREPGEIERLSVAVLVNGLYEEDANGDLAYRERTPEELQRIERLVQSAIGFDTARGDVLTVESLQFMTFGGEDTIAKGNVFTDLLARNMVSILKGLLALAIVAMVLILGVRPALKRALPEGFAALPQPAPAEPEPAQAQIAPAVARPQLPGRTTVSGPDGQVTRIEPALDPLLTEDANDDLVALASVNGGVRRRRVQSVGELVDAEPDESLKVVRHWLAEGA